MSPLLITHTRWRDSHVLCVCVRTGREEREQRGWALKTWANSCGLWDYLSFSFSVCLSFTQGFSHQQGIAPHTFLVMFSTLFCPSLKPYLCLDIESPDNVIVSDILEHKKGWRKDEGERKGGRDERRGRKFVELSIYLKTLSSSV